MGNIGWINTENYTPHIVKRKSLISKDFFFPLAVGISTDEPQLQAFSH